MIIPVKMVVIIIVIRIVIINSNNNSNDKSINSNSSACIHADETTVDASRRFWQCHFEGSAAQASHMH
jgi:hypothetical protein